MRGVASVATIKRPDVAPPQQLHPARHRAAGGSQPAICERWRAMKKGSRGRGERCSTHRECSRELSGSTYQPRVARLSQPEQNGTHGSQAARQLRPDCSTCRARAPAISRRACRAPFTCGPPPAKPALRPATCRYGAAPSRIQPKVSARPDIGCGGATL